MTKIHKSTKRYCFQSKCNTLFFRFVQKYKGILWCRFNNEPEKTYVIILWYRYFFVYLQHEKESLYSLPFAKETKPQIQESIPIPSLYQLYTNSIPTLW